MKGTNISEFSTHNNEKLEELYNQSYGRLMDYIDKTDDVSDNKNVISAYTLYSILKNYYAGLEVAMSADSEELKEVIESINTYVANGYKEVISSKKGNILSVSFDRLLRKIKDSKTMEALPKRYLSLRFYIRQDTTSAVFDVIEDNKYKKVIINRDLSSEDIYYGENSLEDYEAIDFVYDKLIELFDTIDAYRDSLPEQIDGDIVLDDYACKPYEYAKYSAPINSDMVTGEIFVNSNGYVDFDIDITRENKQYHYINSYSKRVKELIRNNSMDILKKVAIDVNSLQDSLKAIVVAYLANNRNLQKRVG